MKVKYGILWIKNYDGNEWNNLCRISHTDINEAHKHAQNMNKDKLMMKSAVVMVAEEK